MYFNEVEVNEEVYSTVYGEGIVSKVLTDSFYTFEVLYENEQNIFYTKEGVPSWGSSIGEQTVFYKSDIDLFNHDFKGIDKVLKPKKILKLKILDMLEMRCPSGLWKEVSKCPKELFEQYIISEKFHLFRKIEEIEEN